MYAQHNAGKDNTYTLFTSTVLTFTLRYISSNKQYVKKDSAKCSCSKDKETKTFKTKKELKLSDKHQKNFYEN